LTITHLALLALPLPPCRCCCCYQIIATALQVICNCMTAPPALAYLLPAPGSTASGAAAAAAADKPLEAHQTPQPGEPPTQADVAVSSTHCCMISWWQALQHLSSNVLLLLLLLLLLCIMLAAGSSCA
jgi:hypothetical protein